jgi:hypothetical protein
MVQVDESVRIYRERFRLRVRIARETRYSQTAIAKLLRIKQDKYKQYETRSMLPYEMLEDFCLACGVTIEWLVTGKGIGPDPKKKKQDK